MRNNFDKLNYKERVENLPVTTKNKKEITRLLELVSDRNPTRIAKYKNSFYRFAWLIEKDFDKLTTDDGLKANAIINKSNLSVKTKQDIISEIKTGFRLLYGKGLTVPECVAVLKMPKSKSKLQLPEELPDEKMIYSMIKACGNARDKFFISLLAFDSGMRPVEARNILWGDIKKDKYGSFITIRTAKDSGDKATRTIRIIKSEPYYQKWNEEYPAEKSDDNFLFVNYSDLKQMKQGVISILFARLKKKLNWKYKLSPYILRHFFITTASKNPEWAVPVLKKFIGHALSSNVISEYQHFGDEDLKDAQLKVNGIIKDKKERLAEMRKPVVCAKCKKSNEYDSEFCTYCNTPLSAIRLVETNETLKDELKEIKDKIKFLMEMEEEKNKNAMAFSKAKTIEDVNKIAKKLKLTPNLTLETDADIEGKVLDNFNKWRMQQAKIK